MVKEFAVRWTVSRGQDTYGYNICTIVGEGIKGRCMGTTACVAPATGCTLTARAGWSVSSVCCVT